MTQERELEHHEEEQEQEQEHEIEEQERAPVDSGTEGQYASETTMASKK
jgi:hypothetical protein